MSSIINPMVSSLLDLGQRLDVRFTDQSANLATCPFCHKGQLAFYPDPLTLGRRFVATCCHRSGDLFDLTSRLQNVSREAAIQYVKIQFPALFDFYQQAASTRTAYEAGRQKIDTIWRAGFAPTEASGLKTYENFISKLPAVFTHVLGWHRENLNMQYRWLTRVRYTAAMATRYTKHDVDWPSGTESALVSYLFDFAGYPSGLIYQWIDDTGTYRQHIHRINEEERDPGLSIHPTQAASNMPLVLCMDPRQQLVATFHAAHFGGNLPNRFVTAFDVVGMRSQSVLPLRRRPITIWVSHLTPYVLRAAIRLNAGITTYGNRDGEFGHDCLDDLNSRKLAEELIRRGVTWQSCLTEKSRQTTPQEIAWLVGAAELSPDELARVKNTLGEPVSRLLSVGSESFKIMTTVDRLGEIEQTPEGWRLKSVRGKSRNKEINVCNIAWRIASMTPTRTPNGESGYDFTVEFYDSGKWLPCTVNGVDLEQRPLQTLRKAAMELGLRPFSMAPEWLSRAVHVALQLTTPPPSTTTIQAGFDIRAGLLRTNSCEISILNGETCRRPATALSLFLPLGDGELPGRRAATHLANDPLLCRLISGLVLQLLAVANGKREPAIVTNRASGTAAMWLLNRLELSTNDPQAIKLEITPPERPITGMAACRQQADGGLSWITGSTDFAHWLAAERPVVWIPQKAANQSLELTGTELQRTVVCLLSSAFRHTASGKPLRKSIQAAWQDLFRQYQISPVGDTCSSPLLPRNSVGYWVSQGLLSMDIPFVTSRPRGTVKPPCWVDRKTKTFWIAKPHIQNLLHERGFPQWKFADMFGSRSEAPLQCAIKSWQATPYLKFSLDILTKKAIAKVLEQQKNHTPLTPKNAKTG